MSNPIFSSTTHERSQMMRLTNELEWGLAERKWEQYRDTCRCKNDPIPGPSYMGTHVCRRCQHTIR